MESVPLLLTNELTELSIASKRLKLPIGRDWKSSSSRLNDGLIKLCPKRNAAPANSFEMAGLTEGL